MSPESDCFEAASTRYPEHSIIPFTYCTIDIFYCFNDDGKDQKQLNPEGQNLVRDVCCLY